MTRKLKLGWGSSVKRPTLSFNGTVGIDAMGRKGHRMFVDGKEIYNKDEYDSIVRQRIKVMGKELSNNNWPSSDKSCLTCEFLSRSIRDDNCSHCSEGSCWTPVSNSDLGLLPSS